MARFRPPLQTQLKQIQHTNQVSRLISEGKIPPCVRYSYGLTRITVFPPFDNGKLKKGLYIDMYRTDRFLAEDEIKKIAGNFMDPKNPNKFNTESKRDGKYFRTVVEEQLPHEPEIPSNYSGPSLVIPSME